MSSLEVAISSFFYQLTLYVAIRLAHRGLTLGELGIVAFGGTVLFNELLNVTIARVCTCCHQSYDKVSVLPRSGLSRLRSSRHIACRRPYYCFKSP